MDRNKAKQLVKRDTGDYVYDPVFPSSGENRVCAIKHSVNTNGYRLDKISLVLEKNGELKREEIKITLRNKNSLPPHIKDLMLEKKDPIFIKIKILYRGKSPNETPYEETKRIPIEV